MKEVRIKKGGTRRKEGRKEKAKSPNGGLRERNMGAERKKLKSEEVMRWWLLACGQAGFLRLGRRLIKAVQYSTYITVLIKSLINVIVCL
jgi:hypothetical protein